MKQSLHFESIGVYQALLRLYAGSAHPSDLYGWAPFVDVETEAWRHVIYRLPVGMKVSYLEREVGQRPKINGL